MQNRDFILYRAKDIFYYNTGNMTKMRLFDYSMLWGEKSWFVVPKDLF